MADAMKTRQRRAARSKPTTQPAKLWSIRSALGTPTCYVGLPEALRGPYSFARENPAFAAQSFAPNLRIVLRFSPDVLRTPATSRSGQDSAPTSNSNHIFFLWKRAIWPIFQSLCIRLSPGIPVVSAMGLAGGKKRFWSDEEKHEICVQTTTLDLLKVESRGEAGPHPPPVRWGALLPPRRPRRDRFQCCREPDRPNRSDEEERTYC